MRKIDNELIEKYRNYLIDEERSQATVEKYVRDIGFFSEWLSGREVNKRLVLEYKEKVMEGHAPRSVNSIISSLNSLFDYLGWHDCRVKTLKIQKQIFADRDRELTEAEYDRLLSAAKSKKNERLYLLMQTICATGIRVSELKYITVEAISNGQADIRCKGKSRVALIPKRLCRGLSKYVKRRNIQSGAVFVTKNGKPLNRSNIWTDMKKLCESAGVERGKVFPHNLRHLFARTYYSIEHDIVRLADILGHSSVNTTRIYTIESGEVHRRQIEQMNLLTC